MRFVLGTTAMLGLACSASAGDLLYENGGLVTHPGQGADGADVSMATADLNFAGSNITDPDWRRADWFWVDGTWDVERVRVFAYETGSSPGPSPFNGVNVDIWDGIPGQGDSQIVASSDNAENVEWSGIYRVFNGAGNLDNTDRPVFQADVLFDDLELEPGFYWISYAAENDDASAWTPYVMEENPSDPNDPITVAGDSWTASSGSWSPTTVGDDDFRPSFPIRVYGTSATGCPEDLTGNGSVGGADLGTLLSAWGPCGDPNDCPEDLTGDGSVGGADLGTLLSAWGDCPDDGLEQPELVGSCCFGSFECDQLTASECADIENSTYTGNFLPCEFADCPPPPLSNCCDPEPGQVGCDDEECETNVCNQDPFCCNFEWDNSCTGLAEDLCGALCFPCGGPDAGFCCGENQSGGCNDEACCGTVCGEDPFCCSNNWDATCGQLARDLCDTCDVEIGEGTVYVFNMRGDNTFFTVPIGLVGLDERDFIGQGLENRPFGMEFDLDGDTLYAINPDPEPNELVTIDLNSGEFNTVAAISGDAAGESTIGGIAFAPDGTVYISSGASLYTIDINTGATTLVGDYPGDAGLIIDIVVDSTGTIFAHSITTDALYEVDPNTADTTFIGEHGFDTNFAQGMSMDRATDSLYATLYVGGGEGYYVQIDTETGESTVLLETTPWNAEMTIAIPNSFPE